MEIKIIESREMQQNCYLIKNGNKGILIDPGLDTEKILKEIKGLEINYILLTHCHFDHIHSGKVLRDGKKVVGSSKCKYNVTDFNMVLYLSESVFERPCDIIMEDGEERDFDGIKVKCIYTPGHTDCSCCYLIENILFSGDTVFKMSIGRCDFPTGSFSILKNSIKEKIYTLPDDTIIYSGHGEETTVGFEKKNNPYVTE